MRAGVRDADTGAEGVGGFVSVVGREFNRDPGRWAVQTMAENERALAGGWVALLFSLSLPPCLTAMAFVGFVLLM